MKYLLIGIGCVVGLGVIVALALVANLIVAALRQAARVTRRTEPIIDPIRKGKTPDRAAIAALAANPEFRNALYEELVDVERADLFPAEYRTLSAFAESALVSWLSHPNELQRSPDEIELVGEHFIDSESDLGQIRYLLYRFRINPPSFAADRSWMAGAVGPFLAGADAPLVLPKALFSELEPFGKRSQEEHVRVVHASFLHSGGIEELRQVISRAGEERFSAQKRASAT